MRNNGCPKHSLGKKAGKKAAYSYISLFLVALIVLSSSYSWFTRKADATINSEEMTLDASNGLRVNDGENISNHISVADFVLDEASSFDGRNLYFPASGNYVKIDTLAKQESMLFREATSGDKNKRFLYKTFTLNGDSSITNVYVRGFNVTVKDTDDTVLVEYDGSTEIIYENGVPVDQKVWPECPVRVAIITDSSEKPVMIDPSAVITQHARNYNAVVDTNDVGSPTIQKTSADAFSTYYGMIGKPLFTMSNDKPVDVTLVAWLEGGLDDNGNSKAQDYVGKKISIDIEVESNWTDMDMVYFVDNTLGDNNEFLQWISAADAGEDKHCVVVMSYLESDTQFEKTVVMEEMEYVKHNGVDCCVKWRAPLPKNVKTNIYFYRLARKNNTIYNSWITRKGINDSLNSTVKGWIGTKKLEEDRGTSTTYTAERGNGYGETTDIVKRLSPCVGYWNGGGSTGGDTPGTSTGGSVTQPTQTTNPSVTTVNIGIYLNISDSFQWMRDDLSSGGNYKLYAVFSNGTKSEMTYASGRCSAINVSIPVNTQLLGFEYRNYKDGTKKDTITADPYTFTDSRNVTYEVTDYGRKAKKTG